MLANQPTAALCFNDAAAFGVCDGLRAAGKEPGRDFGVVGFDDVIEAETAVPALTTVSVDPQGMGRRAAQLLLKQINAGRVEPEVIVSSVRLVVRQSCAMRRMGQSRIMYPAPRMVWSSGLAWPLSILARRRDMWTSMTLVCGSK